MPGPLNWKEKLLNKAIEDNATNITINNIPLGEYNKIKREMRCDFKCCCGEKGDKTIRVIIENSGCFCNSCTKNNTTKINNKTNMYNDHFNGNGGHTEKKNKEIINNAYSKGIIILATYKNKKYEFYEKGEYEIDEINRMILKVYSIIDPIYKYIGICKWYNHFVYYKNVDRFNSNNPIGCDSCYKLLDIFRKIRNKFYTDKGDSQNTIRHKMINPLYFPSKNNTDVKYWSGILSSRCKSRDKKKKIECVSIDKVSIEQLFEKQQNCCYYCKYQLDLNEPNENKQYLNLNQPSCDEKKQYLNLNQPSCDEYKSGKGHTKDNTVISCCFCNYAKNENTPGQWMEIINILNGDNKVLDLRNDKFLQGNVKDTGLFRFLYMNDRCIEKKTALDFLEKCNYKCKITGFPLFFGDGKYYRYYPSFDRKNNDLNHDDDNIQVVCSWVNRARNETTLEYFMKFFKDRFPNFKQKELEVIYPDTYKEKCAIFDSSNKSNISDINIEKTTKHIKKLIQYINDTEEIPQQNQKNKDDAHYLARDLGHIKDKYSNKSLVNHQLELINSCKILNEELNKFGTNWKFNDGLEKYKQCVKVNNGKHPGQDYWAQRQRQQKNEGRLPKVSVEKIEQISGWYWSQIHKSCLPFYQRQNWLEVPKKPLNSEKENVSYNERKNLYQNWNNIKKNKDKQIEEKDIEYLEKIDIYYYFKYSKSNDNNDLQDKLNTVKLFKQKYIVKKWKQFMNTH